MLMDTVRGRWGGVVFDVVDGHCLCVYVCI